MVLLPLTPASATVVKEEGVAVAPVKEIVLPPSLFQPAMWNDNLVVPAGTVISTAPFALPVPALTAV